MTAQKFLEIETSFVEKRDNILTKFVMAAYITAATILFLPFFTKSLFTAILIGVFLSCFATTLLIRAYYHFKYRKVYAIRSDIDRKKWHYLYTEKQWKIRSINVKSGYTFLCLLVTFLLFFVGLKSTPTLLFNAVLLVSIIVLIVIVVTFIINFSAYKASKEERKRQEKEGEKRMDSYN